MKESKLLSRSFMITGVPSTGKTTLSRELYNSCDFTPFPPYTTRSLRLDETNGVDMRVITDGEFALLFNLCRLIEATLHIPYENTGYQGKRYGSPVEWEQIKTYQNMPIGFASFSTLIASHVKGVIGDSIAWIHLTADEKTRETRLRERGIANSEIEQRLKNAKGDSHLNFERADALIDTSHLALSEEVELVKKAISKGTL